MRLNLGSGPRDLGSVETNPDSFFLEAARP